MQITDKVIREERECLNCGEVSEGLFCNNCGQSMETPQRITMKTFGKGVAMSFARLTPGFWATFVGLTLCPWDVIREYLHGKRVKYSTANYYGNTTVALFLRCCILFSETF